MNLTKLLYLALLCLVGHCINGQQLEDVLESAKKLNQEGKYEEAISLLEPVATAYVAEGNQDDLSCHAVYFLSKLYANTYTFETSYAYAFQAEKICESVDNDSMYMSSISIILALSEFYRNPDTVKLYAKKVIGLEGVLPSDRSNAYNSLSTIYEMDQQLDSAFYYGKKATRIDSITQDSSSLPYSYFDLGTFYMVTFQYETALEKMLYGRSYVRKQDAYKLPTIDTRIAMIYFQLGNINKALELGESSYRMATEHNLQGTATRALILLAECYGFRGDTKKELMYYEKADSLNNIKIENEFRRTRILVGKAHAKLDLGLALTNKEIAALRKRKDQVPNELESNKLDYLFLRIDNPSISEFESTYNRLYASATERKADHLLLNLLRLKKRYYTQKGLYEQAYKIDYSIQELEKKRSQLNNEYIIQDLDAKYQKKIKDQEIENLETQNDIQSNIVTQQRIAIIMGSVACMIGIILLTLLFRLFRKTQKQKDIISKALLDKDLLIKEIHHRVKNNLQLVSSLLTLQSRDIDDEKARSAIQDGKSRVRSMALIHQDLYMNEALKEINVKTYLEKLTTDLFLTYKMDQDKIKLELDIEEIDLDVDTIVPLGLIMNELITNSLKYAFDEVQMGVLTVVFKEQKDKLVLTIQDNGKGYDIDEVSQEGFGTTMVQALSRQLNAKVDIESSDGTLTTIILPKKTSHDET